MPLFIKRLKTSIRFFLVTNFFICSTGVFAQPGIVSLLPYPTAITMTNETVAFEKTIKVYVAKNRFVDRSYWTGIFQQMGLEPEWQENASGAQAVFNIRKVKGSGDDESYTLQIAPGKKAAIEATANSHRGILYALQTLRQLAKRSGSHTTFAACSISDRPAFSWRAFMLDESRHFHGKETVKRLLDEMAGLKMNVFHWHLVDDPAWRLEIKKYPELTAIASRGDFEHMMRFRDDPNRKDSLFHAQPARFYTQDNIKEIVAYAHYRGIKVVPEIEVPGHATASIFAYPWLGASSKEKGSGIHGDLYDVTDPKVEAFLHNVLDEVIALFPDGIVHIGGDEADYGHWKSSKSINDFMKKNAIPTYADLQVWAINRMSKYIAGKGYRMIGWNEITGDNVRGEAHVQAGSTEKLAKGTIVQFWDGKLSLVNKAIGQGYDIVNSERHFTYLDYPYEVTSLTKAYSFNPVPQGIAPADQKKILGLGCQMWGEYTPTTERLYYQIFPRIAAFAEIGWVSPATKRSYTDFRKRLETLEQVWLNKGYIKEQSGKY